MDEEVTVRPARPSDAKSFLELFRAVAAERRFIRTESVTRSVGAFRQSFRRPVTPDGATFVAEAGGRVVGHIAIERMAHPVNRHVATLGMMVEGPWRGRGVGSALLEEGLGWARSHGVEKVTLEVYAGNEGGVALYRKFGFVEEGRLSRQSKKSYGYEDEVIMSLRLA
jgi:ribosomal protein S18 acetylase RimI-like enzyme